MSPLADKCLMNSLMLTWLRSSCSLLEIIAQTNYLHNLAIWKDTQLIMQILCLGSDVTDQFSVIYISRELDPHSHICTWIKHMYM